MIKGHYMQSRYRTLFDKAKAIDQDLRVIGNIPEEGLIPRSHLVIPLSLVRRTRGYIEKVANQINGSYENGWFDACAVMIRRLLETLIIEVYEKHRMAQDIKNAQGDFLQLGDLITAIVNEPKWNLSRSTKRALPRLRDVGNKSAHSRMYNAHKPDIDKLIDDLRVTIQELVYLSGLK
jgi:hypothetical protein